MSKVTRHCSFYKGSPSNTPRLPFLLMVSRVTLNARAE
jgi:hypothetical protein